MATPKMYRNKTSRHKPRCEVCGSKLYFRKRHRDYICMNPLCYRYYDQLVRGLKRLSKRIK